MNPRKLNLDIHKLNFDHNGAEGFLWPFPYSQREEFCNTIFHQTTAYIKTLDETVALPYKLSLKNFLIESISIFWGDALRTKFDEHQVTPIPPAYLKYWPHAFENKAPEQAACTKTIMQGPAPKSTKSLNKTIQAGIKKLSKAHKLLRLKKGGLSVDGLKLKPLSQSVLKNDIIATQRTQTITSQAQSSQKDVVYIRSDRWFSEILEDEIIPAIDKLDPQIIDHMISIIQSAYAQMGINCPKHSIDYLKNTLQYLVAGLHIHYTRLIQKPDSLPHHIWTGTGGNIWDLMLRIAVKQNGGTATGHDHGAGLAHVNNYMMGFAEFWGCDNFVTFNQSQANELIEHAKNWTLLEQKTPIIQGLDNSQGSSARHIYPRHNMSPPSKPRKIMLMTEIYDGDRGRPGPSCPDIIQADWQARIVPQLKEWGYDVMMKLHPESPIMPPETFTNDMGANIVTQRMEDVLEEADLIIFDCIYTTSLRVAIETNIPFVLIDFYNHPWTDKGKQLISQRCSFIEGHFDEQGRRNVDWKAMEKGLREAPSKCNNHEFFDYYYA